MGGCSCSGNTAMSMVEFDVNFGKDFRGLAEVHHSHQEHGMNKRLTVEDRFMREGF